MTEAREARVLRQDTTESCVTVEVVVEVAKVKRASDDEPCFCSIVRWVWAVSGRKVGNGRRFSCSVAPIQARMVIGSAFP
jgi:hypothetical protein